MKRMRAARYLGWSAIAGVIVVATAVAFGWVAARRSLWRTPDVPLPVAGLDAAAEVAFDRFGVPHVRAASVEDAFVVEGYLHARERFFQMEMARRAAAGRLAELLGAAAVPADTRLRRWNLAAVARRQTAELDGASRAALEAYARGVNSALAERGPAGLAPEFLLLPDRIEPWRAEDSVGAGLILEMNLTGAWSEELNRVRQLRALGRARAAALWGWSEAQADAWIPPDLAPVGGTRILSGAFESSGGAASNNWAIAPQRTATGASLLANDPHIAVANPATWYEVSLRAPGLALAGVSLAGVPGVVIGHNADVAWGFTMSQLDDQDLFRLRLDGTGERELIGDSLVPLEVRRETVRVRGGEDRAVTVKLSRHGPVIREEAGEVMALAWTALVGRSPLPAFLKLASAASAEQAALAMRDSADAPGLNLVAADRDGHVVWQVVGRAPRRGRGAGRLPAPGWEPGWEWGGLAAADVNPSAADPSSGFVSTANHDPFAEGDTTAAPFPGEFAGPWRVRTIRAALAARADWDAAGCARLQGDVRDGQALALLAGLRTSLERIGSTPARALLAWDGRRAAESREALLWAEFLRELARRVGGDEAVASGLARTPFGGDELLRLLDGTLDAAWWDDVSTPAVERSDEIVAAALAAAAARAGDATWGSRHLLRFHHPLGGVPVLGAIFDRGPFGVGGGSPTINATWYASQGEGFAVTGLASMRFVADVGDWDGSLLTLPLGQSGHLLSSHAADQTADWLAGRMHPMPFTEAGVAATATARVRFAPARR